jgi:hypothetical protein
MTTKRQATTARFDPAAYLERKLAGEPWHLLAREAKMRMGELRAALEAIGADRLAAAGYHSPGARQPAAAPRTPARRRHRPVRLWTPPPAADEPTTAPEPPAGPPPEIPAFDREGGGKLTDKYRPRTLGEVLAQPEAVASLQAFVAAPYSCAMLFHGDSGVGKTSAAYALAHDLGCAVDEAELGGVYEIPSGSQTADSVRTVIETLRYRPLCGSGWRVLMVNGCDRMALPVETIWLDALGTCRARRWWCSPRTSRPACPSGSATGARSTPSPAAASGCGRGFRRWPAASGSGRGPARCPTWAAWGCRRWATPGA